MAERPLLVQFGAGNIGRSLVGQLFSRAGWKVVFLDIDADVVAALNARGGYRVTVKDEILPGQPEFIDVDNVSGVDLRDRGSARRALAGADLIGTSIGAANIEAACRLVAEAAAQRTEPVSVML